MYSICLIEAGPCLETGGSAKLFVNRTQVSERDQGLSNQHTGFKCESIVTSNQLRYQSSSPTMSPWSKRVVKCTAKQTKQAVAREMGKAN